MVICSLVISVVAFATQTENLNNATVNDSYETTPNVNVLSENATENKMLLQVISNSNVVKGYTANGLSREDVENGITTVNTEIDISFSTAIKVYNAELNGNSQTLEIANDHDGWIVPCEKNGKLSYITISKKTEDGSWYVSSVKTPYDSSELENFIDKEILNTELNTKEITNADIKYVNILNKGIFAISVKSHNAEYIIPYNSNNLVSNNLYTLNEVKSLDVQ